VVLHTLNLPTDEYVVTTEVFAGPLDLLLDLIEKAQLDITRLALAQVTDQYLAYLHSLSTQNAAEVSAFLVIAAKLLQIKSEALLPRPPEREVGEEDPGEALAQQLRTYRKFKRVAEWLAQRVNQHLQTYLHLATPIKIESRFDLNGITLTDLVLTALSVYQSQKNFLSIDNIISVPKITIREKIYAILASLKIRKEESFRSLMGQNHTRLDAVVIFLAVLELIKRQVVEVNQESLFADIFIHPLADWNPEVEFDLEFGD
jgi:segregation and condensation protein A